MLLNSYVVVVILLKYFINCVEPIKVKVTSKIVKRTEGTQFKLKFRAILKSPLESYANRLETRELSLCSEINTEKVSKKQNNKFRPSKR